MESSGSPSSLTLPPQPPPADNCTNMDVHMPLVAEDPSSAIWDWNDLLDFTVDFPVSVDSGHNNNDGEHPQYQQQSPIPLPQPQLPTQKAAADRVRKRDPRLICSNFLAGMVPCACPELDEKLEAEAEGLPGKKRVRVSRSGSGLARCQVPGCEADISALKGYHKRHRVCLRCAHATSVLLDGQNKRYCQQCGKFHLLSDFDEGKRSCRRKLEKHNRRRRKPTAAADKEEQMELQTEETTCSGEEGKETLCISTDIADEEALMDSEPLVESEDGHVSFIHSDPKPLNDNSDSVVTFAASGITQMDGGKDDCKYSLSPSLCDNKSAYSSMCPTGRISFKLYDWNPAEFPRRLRLQIFQWLANMPVELEGYIRPGCTILTLFIAMPTFMWEKLSKNPVAYIEDFVVAPGRILSGRGCVIVYLNNMIFHVIEGMGVSGTSVMKVGVKVQAPRLHYVYPTCFEAGKPIEFVACGSNLLQHKFRFLVSFAGKYLASDYRVESPYGQIEGHSGVDHQLYKIYIPCTEPNLFGPAFVEVENESGLSNFIPVLIGDKETYSEMKTMQQRFDADTFAEESQFAAINSLSGSCEVATARQSAFSELLLDIAWLLKDHTPEDFGQIVASSHIQRFNRVLNFLLQNESLIILDKILTGLRIMIDKMGLSSVVESSGDGNMMLLKKNMDCAREIIHQKLQNSGDYGLSLKSQEDCGSQCCSLSTMPSVVPIIDQDAQMRGNDKLGVKAALTSIDRTETVPLLDSEVVMDVSLTKEWPRKSCSRVFSSRVLSSRTSIVVIATAAICFGMCAVLLHPQKVGEFAVTVRRCLTNLR